MRFYYGGYSAGATSSDNSLHTSGIGVATLPRDRFAGITPLELTDVPTQRNPVRHVGQVTMKKCNLSQYQRLELNADAEGGSIRVEVLDAAGRRVPGFLQEDAVAITGDALRHRVYWQDHELGDLPDGEYMLRLHLDGATVFAIYPVA
jgi:hypothetical protein